MEQYIIKGGNPLVGEVVIGGAKNAALPVLAAAVMTDGKCMIDNMPDVRDINVLLQAMQEIGADVDRTGKHEVTISGKGIHPGATRRRTRQRKASTPSPHSSRQTSAA